ncbi:MAG: TM2 domain-containing protein [Bacteroidales bacterium]|nr:TM2 domain-containing protein [Bacteroidales bacterium]
MHRFYLGYTWQGIVQLLTLGGLGIWTLIDLIRIITRDLQPKSGHYTD